MKPDFITVVLTRVGLAGLLLALFVPTTPQVMGEANALIGNSVCESTVQVRLVPACSAGPSEDHSHVVVCLVPTKPRQVARLHTEPPHCRIMQNHKMFEPRLLVVPAGSIIEFPNRDPWLRNVFSVSRSIRLDRGLYEARVQKAVAFDRTGVSYLFCNIHPEMMAIVLTVNSAYFGVSVQRSVFVGDDNRSQPTISIALAN